MDQARMDKAMTRIEAALSRIETAGAARRVHGTTGEAERALRAKVGDALKELDSLIAELDA